MKQTRIIISLFVLLLVPVYYAYAQSESTTITIQNADGTFFSSANLSQSLSSNLEFVENHCSVEASNGVACPKLKYYGSTLQSLLDLVPKKLALVAAQSSFPEELKYPINLIGDAFPPQISQVNISIMGEYASWATDEYSTSELEAGTKGGQYSNKFSNGKFVYEHLLGISGLSGSIEYFYRIRSTDRSGNVGEYFIPGFSVSGSVKDNEQRPISDAIIQVNSYQGARTNTQGQYSLGGLSPGQYVVTVSHPQYKFEPNSKSINSSVDLTGINFTGTPKVEKLYLPLVRR